ncbi:AraC family transcriptional regulator [Marinagarivorans cellulosilyticus]|uniref:HTH araC/xylS-type domain-containing protein n=1 Tax=Marinagarivorans cellulosilyticus TaxID=2721545 RepID=A0AAN1WE16_9GAMM|nr:AraC family transcriptional regulator [Marinagarivorans cellulosilyticus]BCD95862.1 hypothetical protein MARGE09_P0061 [Marinagarivorans cellulosilyticus]
MSTWLERDIKFIAASGQPSVLVDVCLQRGIDSHRLLNGTGLFLEHVLSDSVLMNAEQYLKLIQNACVLLNSDDTPFLLGQRWLPGAQGGASLALKLANNLQQALEAFIVGKAVLSPVITPHLVVDEHHGYLYWQDSFGAAANYPFLLVASMVSIVAFSRRQANQQLPWKFYFRHDAPEFLEQYWVHLGLEVHFNQPFDVMCIPRQWLVQCWQQSTVSAQQVALAQTQQQLQKLPAQQALLEEVRHFILSNVEGHPNLDALAAALNFSPATLKRKLKKHGSHYQQQLDSARLQHALYLLTKQKLSCEQVANRLCFHDTASFRRSFKRWAGANPNQLLHKLTAALWA